MERSRFFEAFMKQQKYDNKRDIAPGKRDFFFSICSDDKGLYVKTVNKNLRDIKVPVEKHSGYIRAALEIFSKKKIESRLIVDWSNPYSRIYLDKNGDLMNSLFLVDNLINETGSKIYSGDRDYPVKLNVIDKGTYLQCSLTVANRKIDRVINENYMISTNKIHSVLPLGINFKSLLELDTTIQHKDINNYFSIVLSNFSNIDIHYDNFICDNKSEIELSPSLLIDSVDESGFVTIQTTFSYTDVVSPEFYFKYSPSKFAILNNSNRELEIYDLLLPDGDLFDRLVKILFYIEKKHEMVDSFNIEKDEIILHPQLATIFFGSELKTILDNFSIYGDRILKKNRLKRAKIGIELVLTSAIDYLQGSAFLKIYGENIPLFKALSIYEERGYIPLKDGSRGIVDSNYINKLRRVIHEGKDGIEISFFDLPYIETELEASIKGDEFRERLLLYQNSIDEVQDFKIDYTGFSGELREYQKKGILWMNKLNTIGISGCLADDMGLGKTVQTLVFLLQIKKQRENRPILIVMPKSLIFNWIKEIEKFTPDFSVYSYYGANRSIDLLRKGEIVLTTYHTLRNDIEKIKEVNFFYTILDEIQNIKRHSSKLSRACYLLKSQFRLGISGTPVENSLSDLYSISRFLNPTLFGSFKKFKDEWSGPITSDESEIVTNQLKAKIRPLFLRRLKEDVLEQLPPKSEQILYVDMSEEQKSLYETVRKDYHDKIRLKIRDEGLDMSKFTIIKAFTELRQIATTPELKSGGIIESPKKELLMEHLKETLSGGHKILIFSNFLSSISEISRSLSVEKIEHGIITGSTSNREEIVDNFMTDKQNKVLLMTLKTGGVGLNLTAASYVYIVDPWWNLASENQAIDRTHRIGQKNSVFCYRFIARGTIEEKIIELQEKKRALFDNLFSINSGEFSFETEDIDYLLG
jgi:superfamily II DNA or RNA helicase